MEQQIVQSMTISEILSRFPSKSQRLAQAITNAGLHCTSCNAATWETLEAGMLGHGMSERAIDKLLKELNAILAEPVDMDTITLTPQAADKIRSYAAEEDLMQAGLRFGDTAGGCGGFQYVLDLCEEAEEDDVIFESQGLKIYVKAENLPRLMGSVIDYVDGFHGAGFKVSNPQVKKSCGCGNSQRY